MQNSLSVLWYGFCLLLGLSVSCLVVIGIGFFLVVGGYVWCWVCLWVGKYVIMPFNSREGVSVGLCNYRF